MNTTYIEDQIIKQMKPIDREALRLKALRILQQNWDKLEFLPLEVKGKKKLFVFVPKDEDIKRVTGCFIDMLKQLEIECDIAVLPKRYKLKLKDKK